jgi:hypothetical protein
VPKGNQKPFHLLVNLGRSLKSQNLMGEQFETSVRLGKRAKETPQAGSGTTLGGNIIAGSWGRFQTQNRKGEVLESESFNKMRFLRGVARVKSSVSLRNWKEQGGSTWAGTT